MIEERQVTVIPQDTFTERYFNELFRFHKDEERKCPAGLQVRMSHLLKLKTNKKEVKENGE